MENSIRALMVKVAYSYLGAFYRWGGDDPSGFDCSGLVVEILKSAGLLEEYEDCTAHALYQRFIETEVRKAGNLVCWKADGSNLVRHVGMLVGELHYIGANGGSSKIVTLDDAIKNNAFIKVRPIPKGVLFLDPFRRRT